MAANSKSRGIASLGKRFVKQIWSGSSRDPSHLPSKPNFGIRSVHASVYDKNPDDLVGPSVVPDDLIPSESDKYWAPHPETGVFGPGTDDNEQLIGERGFRSPTTNTSGGDTVLEQQVWFRPLEDVEKPRLP